MKILATIMFCLLYAATLFAQMEVNGFSDSYHAVRIKAPNDYLASRNRLRIEATNNFNTTSLFVSLNAMHNYVLPDQTGIELREAYFDYVGDNFDLRVGRQIIIWGKADGMRITDYISPYDLTEFLARDYDDVRMPVDAFKFRYLGESMDAELIWLPIFQKGIMPGEDNPWAKEGPDFSEYDTVNMLEVDEPEQTIDNSEIGARVSFYLHGLDISISSLYTWSDFPVLQITPNGKTAHISQEYYRYGFVGADMSCSMGAFVLRGEAAYYIDKKYQHKDLLTLSQRNSVSALAGLDWYPGNEWTISTQLTDEMVLDHHADLEAQEHTWLSTLNISKLLFRSTLKLSTFSYIGLDGNNFFNRNSADYALTDEMHLLLGIDVFSGETGMFGQYNDNSEIWIKAKYSF